MSGIKVLSGIRILGPTKTCDANRGIKSPEGRKLESILDKNDKESTKNLDASNKRARLLNKALDAKIKSINVKARTEVSALEKEKKMNTVKNNKFRRTLEAGAKQIYKETWTKIQVAEKAYKKANK